MEHILRHSKLCLGPMSMNIIDSVIDFSNKTGTYVTFIPSRRQIEWSGGYVNNWTTEDFSNYIKSKSRYICIQRDHGGPGQGSLDDDGYESLKHDCKFCDSIHIDPWKKYSRFADGLKWTIDLLNFCYQENPNLYYEVGTEEAIRKFTAEEVEKLLYEIKKSVKKEIFERILFCVIQSGTALKNGINTGKYNDNRLIKMINVVKTYKKLSKEHNGDYMDKDIMIDRFSNDLDSLNIAPELGVVETKIILEDLRNKNLTEKIDKFYKICLDSGKWKKWVSDDFIPENNKEKLIEICGHYVFSHPCFNEIKMIEDSEIKRQLYQYLESIYTPIDPKTCYMERLRCCICDNDLLQDLLGKNSETPISLNLFEKTIETNPIVPYNIVECVKCKTSQIKYLGDIRLVYGKNHIDAYGSVKSEKHQLFKNFIVQNKDIESICEIGAATGDLAHGIIKDTDINYKIVEPNYKGKQNDKLYIINSYFEEANIESVKATCLVMSDVFEHFYSPLKALKKIVDVGYDYVILNHPDFDHAIETNHCIILNIEHTFQIEHQLLFNLFSNFGYTLNRRYNFKNFSLFLEFKKQKNIIPRQIKNINTSKNIRKYIHNIETIAENINKYIHNNQNKEYYIWPCSVHTTTLFLFGLYHKKFKGILDNSPNKVGTYIDGYKLFCSSFNEIIESDNENIVIIISGANAYIKELDLQNKKVEIKLAEDFK